MMGTFFANQDTPSHCTATDCLVTPGVSFQVQKLFQEHYPECSVTLSCEVGQIGFMERENASILNESLKPLCAKTVTAFRAALGSLGLTCPFYLTQNDGTLLR